MKKSYSLLNIYFLIIVAINFCISSVFYLTTIISTSFALEVLDASISTAGLASGIFVIGTTLARVLLGKHLDSINLKAWLLIGLLIYIFSTALYFASVNIYILCAVRLMNGVSYGICSSVCGVIVVRLIPSFKRGAGIGYYALGSVIASALASFLGVQLLTRNSFNLAFLISLGILIFSCCLILVMRVREAKNGVLNLEATKRNFIAQYFEPSAINISLIAFIVGLGYGGIIGFIGEFCKERDLMSAGSMFFAIYALISLFARPIAGNIFDKKGHNFVLIPALIFFALALFLFAFARNSFMLILSAILVGAGYGNFFSSAQSYAIKVAPKNKVGLASSSYFMSLDLGIGVGPYLLGIIVNLAGFQAMFVSCAILICASLAIYMRLIFRA